jgi:hypothetical protein
MKMVTRNEDTLNLNDKAIQEIDLDIEVCKSNEEVFATTRMGLSSAIEGRLNGRIFVPYCIPLE